MPRILFLAANPIDKDHLRIRGERNKIHDVLNKAEIGNQFDLIAEFAVNASELQELLFRHNPTIVHFSGHGEASGEICFEDEEGVSQPVDPQTLASLFSIFNESVRCIVLNACYSQEQAEALAQHIDCVMGMNDAISDPAALSFATALYRAFANRKSLRDSFDLACNQLDLQRLDESHKPLLLAERIDASKVYTVDWDNPTPDDLSPAPGDSPY